MERDRCMARVLALAGALVGSACQSGVSPDSGLSAYLRATGGQYEPGELGTEPEADKPVIDTIRSANTRVFAGAVGRSFSGSVGGTATAVLIGLQGDSAH